MASINNLDWDLQQHPTRVPARVDEKLKKVFEEVRKYRLLYDPDDALYWDGSAREHAFNQLEKDFGMPDFRHRWSDVFERARKLTLSLEETFHLEWLIPFARKISVRQEALQGLAFNRYVRPRGQALQHAARQEKEAKGHTVALSYESDDDLDPQPEVGGRAQRFTWTDDQTCRAFAAIRKQPCLYDPRHFDYENVIQRAEAWKHIIKTANVPNVRILWRTVFETRNANLLTIAPWYQRRLAWLQPYLSEIAEHKRKKKANLNADGGQSTHGVLGSGPSSRGGDATEPVDVKPPTSQRPPGSTPMSVKRSPPPQSSPAKRAREVTEPVDVKPPTSNHPPGPTSTAANDREATEPVDVKRPMSKRPFGPTPSCAQTGLESMESAEVKPPPMSKRPAGLPSKPPMSKCPPGPTPSCAQPGLKATEPSEVKPPTSQRTPGLPSKPPTYKRPSGPTSSSEKRPRPTEGREIKLDPDSARHLLPRSASQRRALANKLFGV